MEFARLSSITIVLNLTVEPTKKLLERELSLRGVADTKAAIAVLPREQVKGLRLDENLHELSFTMAAETRVSLPKLILSKATTLKTLRFSGGEKRLLDYGYVEEEEDEEEEEEEEEPTLITEGLGAVLVGCALEELVLCETGSTIDLPRAFRQLLAAAALVSMQLGVGVELTEALLDVACDRCPLLAHARFCYIT